MFAQLRDVLTAKDSTPVAKKNQYCRLFRPQRAQTDQIALGIGQRDGSELIA